MAESKNIKILLVDDSNFYDDSEFEKFACSVIRMCSSEFLYSGVQLPGGVNLLLLHLEYADEEYLNLIAGKDVSNVRKCIVLAKDTDFESINRISSVNPEFRKKLAVYPESTDLRYIMANLSFSAAGESIGNDLVYRSKYENLFNNIRCASVVYEAVDDGSDFIITEFNSAAELTEKVDRDAVIGKRVTEVFPGVREFGLLDVFKRVFTTGKSEHHPISLYEDENIFGWRENFVYKLPTGEITTIYDDVTKIRKNEFDLKYSKDLLEGLFENLPLGISIWNKNGELLKVNPAFVALTGYRFEDIPSIGDWFLKAYPENDYRKNVIEDWQGDFDKKTVVWEFEICCKNREKKAIEFRASHLDDERIIVSMVDITIRKKTEEKIRNDEERWRAYVENAPYGIFIVDGMGRYLRVNPAACLITGRSESELLKISLRDLCPEEYQDECLRHFAVVKSTGKSEGDLKFVHSNGEHRWWSVNAVKLNDDLYIGFTEDITERKKMEMELKKLNDRMKLAADSARMGVWDYFIESDKLILDDWMFRLFDLDPAEFDGTYSSWQKRVHADDVDMVDKKVKNAFANEEEYDCEFRIILGDGGIKHIKACGVVSRDEFGKAVRMTGINYDITDRKKAEEDLRESEERYQCLSEGSFEAIFLSENGICTGQNSTAGKMFGYGLQEALGKPGTDWIHPDYRYIVKDNIMKDIAEPYEAMALRKDGSVFPCEIQASMTTFKGKPMRITVLRDITAKKKAESERNQAMNELLIAKERAEESDRLKSAFLANVSHEIRTPMNGILGFAELLKKPGLTGEQQSEYIDLIEKSGSRMLKIINDIIDISKIESGQMKVTYSSVKINQIMKNVFAFFKPETALKGLGLSLHIPEEPYDDSVETDEEKIYAILINLVKNAVKYTNKGEIHFGYSVIGEFIEFYVRDTGIGIYPDRRNAIFERFVQADISPYKPSEGAGLGLSITKAYVHMLGGDIRVESEFGEGSVFYFTIPIGKCSPEKCETATEVESKGNEEKTPDELRRKLKILIAEDDKVSSFLLERIARDYSREIIKTDNGKEAVKIVYENPDIDLIFMDFKLPGMDGHNALKAIRGFNNKVYVVVQTANVMYAEKENAYEAGCDDFITKPFKIGELENIIKSLI